MAKELDKATGWAAQMAERKPPRAALDWNEAGTLAIQMSGAWERILRASGNTTVSDGLVSQTAMLGSHGKRVDPAATDFALGFLDAMQPEDAAEALLLTQMAATHQAVMMLARRLNHVENIPQQDAAERALNKLGRADGHAQTVSLQGATCGARGARDGEGRRTGHRGQRAARGAG